jgi:hypothetical protein
LIIYIIVNKKLLITTDCSSSINITEYTGSNDIGKHLTSLDSAKYIGCIVRDIEYKM